ncbi:class I SAM-dependent RNA methyltransferase [Mesorhizobium sp. RP14(2022)]|uniref:Class I SAM-dependent RNA methyltransferase n=1 Tax=Mesorhizobium liriopis TaxID=2953882 RepID=A0ABT1C131_9HYPH|nr:class I SAM-dependent RNA methyltransferase [Mesorhizobium liriopis]MCO6048539.1 class I SAM-dependent RNA methyltransferase [Mesorhizobium liriopis]
MSETLTIERLAAGGDGLAHRGGKPVHVPFTLPGEEAEVRFDADGAHLLSLLRASPQRVEPPCRHFGTCGSCALQHMEDEAYRAWKRERVVHVLESAGIAAEVAPLIPCAPRSRRRVALTARLVAAGALLGFNRVRSHEIVDLEENWIALPLIVDALPMLRRLVETIAKTPKSFRLLVTATASGLDVSAEESGKLSESERRAASDFAVRNGLARLSVDGEIIVEPRKPVVMMGEAAVNVPPGAFVQAVAETEDAMVALVLDHVKKSKHVADLFAGCGAFTFRLARNARVHAVESDAAAIGALDRAARATPGLKPITPERRDLFRRPLTAKELNTFDAVVFDPPRAGAEFQSRELAKSTVPRVAAVSCNPTTLARDLSILVAGGYRVTRVVPLDQFLWSSHVEAVALLEKPKSRR